MTQASAPPVQKMVVFETRRCYHCKAGTPHIEGVCVQCLKDGCEDCTREIRSFSRFQNGDG